ncbi:MULTISPECIES: arylamine N-acetyltransferase [Streptomyces]|uniref:Arylamine N-acetyltransferase n=2 Tax=Streptomyces TaxID=1883 RepID=A0ABV9IM09_9ACTN
MADTPEGDLDVYRDGELQYRVELRPRALTDFATACWWHTHAPQAHFTRNLVCSLPTDHARRTDSGDHRGRGDSDHGTARGRRPRDLPRPLRHRRRP